MGASNSLLPGYFISYPLWQEALRLLNYQLEQKKSNRHYNTLSMFYYESLGDTARSLATEEYYEQRIASGMFYGLEREFALFPYPIPKSRLGLRDYKFMTYPMRALYYSVCLYILQISQDFVRDHFKSRPNVHSFYGGDLVFHDGGLVLNRSTTYFLNHYRDFRTQVRREAEANFKHKLMLRLDITSYSIPSPTKAS